MATVPLVLEWWLRYRSQINPLRVGREKGRSNYLSNKAVSTDISYGDKDLELRQVKAVNEIMYSKQYCGL